MSKESGGQERFQRVILLDEPSCTDDFHGLGHKRTAAALASTIRQFEGKDRSIGLEGVWGAGKSTIVKIAQEDLSSSDNGIQEECHYAVFTFDLWSNQTEHFKRAFLESFVEWSLEEFPNKKKYLDDKFNQIRDKKTRVFSEHLRHFSKFGMLAIVFLYISPILYAWLTPAGFGSKKLSVFVDKVTVSGPLIAQIVIATFLFTMIISAIKSSPKVKGKIFPNLRKGFSKSFSFFNKEADRTQTNQSIRDEDPTQYEFTKIFREMVEKLQSDDTRIVVVFDNIDRLPHDKISDVWSQVRSAFYHRQARDSKEQERRGSSIIAIVPYAQSVVLQDNERGHQENKRSQIDYIEADVFRKSFDAIFHVSPPILSEASAFFKSKFSTATQEKFQDDTTSRVYRIFDVHIRSTGRPVTPRQVIAFINDMTSWYEQWQGAIPIETIAVFVANQSFLLENPENFLLNQTLDKRMVNHADRDNLVRDLAALAYNVEPELALQILSGDAIANALTSKNASNLIKLAESSESNGLTELISKIVEENMDDWITSPETEYASAVSNLAELPAASSEITYVRTALLRNFRRLEPVSLKSLGKDSPIWRIVEFSTPENIPNLADIVSKWLTDSLPKVDDQEFNDGQQWVVCIGDFLSASLKSHGQEITSSAAKRIKMPGGAEAIVGAAFDFDKTKFHARQLKPIINKRSVLSSLLEHVTSGSQFWYAWPELRHLFDMDENVALMEAVTKIIVAEKSDHDNLQTHYRFKNYWSLYRDTSKAENQKKKSTEEIFLSGAGAYYAHQMSDDDDSESDEIVAIILTLALLELSNELPAIPNANAVPVFGDVTTADNWIRDLVKTELQKADLVKQISANILEVFQFGKVLRIYSTANETRSFLEPIVNCLIDNELSHAPKANDIIDNYHALEDRLGNRFKPLLKTMGARNDDNYWQSINFKKVPISLVRYAAERDESGWQKFVSKLDTQLRALPQEQWIEASTENRSLFEILSARNIKSPLLLPVDKYRESLVLNVLDILAGLYDPTDSDRDYSKLLDAIPPNSRSKFYNEIFERHDRPTENIVLALRKISIIFDNLPFAKNPERTIQRYLMPALRAADDLADEFIKKHSDRFSTILTGAEDVSRGEVQEFLEGLLGDEENSERAIMLLKSLKLSTPKQKRETDSAEK